MAPEVLMYALAPNVSTTQSGKIFRLDANPTFNSRVSSSDPYEIPHQAATELSYETGPISVNVKLEMIASMHTGEHVEVNLLIEDESVFIDDDLFDIHVTGESVETAIGNYLVFFESDREHYLALSADRLLERAKELRDLYQEYKILK